MSETASAIDPISVAEAIAPIEDGVPADEQHARNHTAFVSVAAAFALVCLQLGVGLLTGSLGLISAGVESSGDVVAAVLTVFALRLSGRPADADHNYGHRRAENLAALGEAGILAGGGVVVVVETVRRLISGSTPFTPHWYVFVVIAAVLAVDSSRFLVSSRSAVKYNSTALRANAVHFASDIAGAVVVLVGLILVSEGFKQGDSVAALAVAGIIFAASAKLIMKNAQVLMDAAPTDAQVRAQTALDMLEGVELRRLRLRESGGRYFADVTVAVAPGQAVIAGHGLADEVEEAIHTALPGSDVVVHLEPKLVGLELRDHALALALAEPLVREAHDIVLYENEDGVSISLHLKLEATVPLVEAHEISERVETALAAVAGVASVHTHLEPLEQPLLALPGHAGTAAEEKRIRELVVAATGRVPRELLFLNTDAGRVIFLTVAVRDDCDLTEAHELAGSLEEDIRRDQPHMVDVVVHTEP